MRCVIKRSIRWQGPRDEYLHAEKVLKAKTSALSEADEPCYRSGKMSRSPKMKTLRKSTSRHLELEALCNTPCPKLLIWSSSTRGTGLHTHSTSLMLPSSSLRVKGLIRMCYIWNDKAYKLALTHLNFQCGTKPTNNNSTCATWATWANFTTTTSY
jgi:hypothetical protein